MCPCVRPGRSPLAPTLRNAAALPRPEAPVSTLAIRIVEAAARADVSVAELTALAQSDPAFAIRLLAVVNSPAFGMGARVTDLRRAVTMVGLRGVRNIALSLSLTQMVPLGADGEALLSICLRRAVASRFLAEALGERPADDHFTTGLFLEAGILAWAVEDLGAAAAVARGPAHARTILERAAGRPDHPTAGAEIVARWKLPEATGQAIARHHDPFPPEGPERVEWAAERVAAVFEGGNLAAVRADAAEALRAVGAPDGLMDRLLAAVPPLVRETSAGFDRAVGEQFDVDTLLLSANRSLVELNEHYLEMIHTLERVLQERETLAVELERKNAILADLANYDGLTGLANRRRFTERLDADLARADRERAALSLVLLDVDHFKRFNDTLGHLVGDEVLRVVGRVLKEHVRGVDLAARYGGEEFALVLPDTPLDCAFSVAERVRAAVAAATVRTGQGTVSVTVSAGVAAVHGPGCAHAAGALAEAADRSLYHAKARGRNRVERAAA